MRINTILIMIIIKKIPNILFVVVGGEIEDSGWNSQVKTFLNKNKDNILITVAITIGVNRNPCVTTVEVK